MLYAKVYWTNHAIDRLEERFHDAASLRETITTAAQNLPKWRGRYMHYVVEDARCVFEKCEGGVRVITVYGIEECP